MGDGLNVLICGAGIAGLTAAISIARNGHRVQIVDEAKALSPIGVGIHVPPNSTRVLSQWGLQEKLEPFAVRPDGFSYRRYATGEVLGSIPPAREMPGAPYWTLKRADLQKALHDAAIELGCSIRLSAKVVQCDEERPSVTLESGETVTADLIVAADGIRSRLRSFVIPEHTVELSHNPLTTYRAMVEASDMLADPATAPLVENPKMTIWIGYRRNVVLYPVARGKRFFLGGICPGKTAVADWDRDADSASLAAQFQDFEPAVRGLFDKVSSPPKQFSLAEVPSLPRWLSRSGKVVLMGDAAHAMLPYMGQGAAMAVEDAAALGQCLARVSSPADIPKYMGAYERIRKWRAERVARNTRRNGEVSQMADGEEQERRDAFLASRGSANNEKDYGDRVDMGPWWDPDFVRWLMSYDAIARANQVLDELKL